MSDTPSTAHPASYAQAQEQLVDSPRRWLVTGVAGFIGSNLLEALLRLGQSVVGLDNFATGHRRNLEEVRGLVGQEAWSRFRFIEGDICDLATCLQASDGAQVILHQAALGSVPRSIENPIRTNETNIGGFLNMLIAAREAEVSRFVYAASSSTYGDHPALPKVEDQIGQPLSPYAVTKRVNELYADVFFRCYGVNSIGLRYFNVFGPRQDPEGAYAAVIPKWIAAMIRSDKVLIHGDGQTSRDFCYVANAVQANLLAGVTEQPSACNQIYNVAVGESTSLIDLYGLLRENLQPHFPHLQDASPVFDGFRQGDVRHSLADISKASRLLGYSPAYRVPAGLQEAMGWYRAFVGQVR